MSKILIWLFIFSFTIFLLFSHLTLYGYEPETWNAAQQLVDKGALISTRAGFIQVASYIPFVFAKVVFNNTSGQLSGTWIPAIAISFYSAFIPVVYFLLVNSLFSSKRTAITMSVLLASATMVLPYSIIGMEHLLTLFLLLLTLFIFRYSKNLHPKELLLAGIAAGLAYGSKGYGGIVVIPTVIFLLYYNIFVLKISISRTIKHMSMFILPCLIFTGIGILYNYARFGNILTGAYNPGVEFQYGSIFVGLYGYFFSSGKSIFIFTPLLLSAILYYKKFKRVYPAFVNYLIILGIIFLSIQAPFTFWTDETWGPRKLLPLLPIALLPLGVMISRWQEQRPWQKIFFYISLGMSFYVQLLSVLYDYGKQLTMLRAINLDSLPFMQFIPNLSHLYINTILLKFYIISGLGLGTHLFTFQISSWLRRVVAGTNDGLISGGSVILSQEFTRPEVWWLHSTIPGTIRLVGCFILIGIAMVSLRRVYSLSR